MAVLDNFEAPFNEDNVSIWDNVKKWTLISALVGIVFQLIQQITGVMSKGMGVIVLYSIVSLGIGIAIYVFALREHRDQELGGFMSFKRGFVLSFAIGMISAAIVLIFNYIYMNFINPSAIDQQLEMVRNMTESMVEKFNLPEEAIDKAVEEQRKSLTSPFSILKGLLGMSIFAAIFSLIVAAIMKKNRPMF